MNIVFGQADLSDIDELIRMRIAYMIDDFGSISAAEREGGEKQLLKNDSHWKIFAQNIELLFEKYESVDIKKMGFPAYWKELLEMQ